MLTDGERVLAKAEFPLRSASAVLTGELRRMLASTGIALRDLGGIGVVSGPGSFTGVRTGLAMAKGLCEVAGVPLASVSRLEVLAEAADLARGVRSARRRPRFALRSRAAKHRTAHEYLVSVERV